MPRMEVAGVAVQFSPAEISKGGSIGRCCAKRDPLLRHTPARQSRLLKTSIRNSESDETFRDGSSKDVSGIRATSTPRSFS